MKKFAACNQRDKTTGQSRLAIYVKWLHLLMMQCDKVYCELSTRCYCQQELSHCRSLQVPGDLHVSQVSSGGWL